MNNAFLDNFDDVINLEIENFVVVVRCYAEI